MAGKPELLTDRPDPLIAEVLEQLHLSSALFLRAEYRDPWAYESPVASDLCAVLRPGAERLILFHIVARGQCWIEVEGEPRLQAQQGDVIVLPYSDLHRMGGLADAPAVPIGSLLPAPPWNTMPVIRHGGDGVRTDVVCGYLESDELIFDPILRTLPRLFAVRPDPAAVEWVKASVEYALQASRGNPTGMEKRLPELLFAEILRLHVERGPASSGGWLAAAHDPIVGSAMRALHADPIRKWSVHDLARAVATSRTVLEERFRSVLGRSPMRYLTQWRLQLAARRLTTTNAGVAEIAYEVGYESEASFTRAFKRLLGEPPARWREARKRIRHQSAL